MNKVFVNQPSNLRKGNLDPLGPLRPPGPPRYFGLPIINPSRPPLPPNKLYHQPLNYPEYVKDSNLNVHVRVFKVIIRANIETNDVKIINLFSFTLKDIVSN